MHMTDALETAAAVGLSLKPKRADEPSMTTPTNPLSPRAHNFDRMVEDWLPLTYVLNNLNRGLGLADSYPFVLSPPVIEKLRFIHDTIYVRAEPAATGVAEGGTAVGDAAASDAAVGGVAASGPAPGDAVVN
jgi:hypothetical protein